MNLRQVREDNKVKCIKLAAQGLSSKAIGQVVGISPVTIATWKRSDPLFAKAMDKVKSEAARDLVEHSLFELAKGAKEETITEKYMVTEMVDGEEKSKEVTKTIKYKAPSEKAIAMVAYKHDRGSYASEEKETNNLTIKITQQNRSLSVEERRALLVSEGTEAIEVDYKELRANLESEAGELGLLGDGS